MSPAVPKLKEALAATNIQTPRIPVISNVDAVPHSDPEAIKEILSQQITSPVIGLAWSCLAWLGLAWLGLAWFGLPLILQGCKRLLS